MLAAIRQQARRHIRAGDIEAANDILATEPGLALEPDIISLRAQIALRQGAAGEARRLLDLALQRDPAHSELRITLARLDLQEGRVNEAIELLRRHAIDPALAAPAQKLLARAHLVKGDARAAADVLSAVARANPSDLDSARKAIELLTRTGARAEAADLAAAMLAAHPDDIDMLRARVDLLIGGSDAEALIAAGRILAKSDGNSGLRVARHVLDLGRPDDAAEILLACPDPEQEQHRSFATVVASTLLDAASESDRAGDHAGQLRALERARALAPDYLPVAREFNRLFREAFAAGADVLRGESFAEAMTLFDRALAFDPHHEGALDSLARAAAGAGAYEAAVSALKRLTEIHPDDRALLRRLARELDACGDLAPALHAERRLIDHGVVDSEPRFARLVRKIAAAARLEMAEGDLDRAYESICALRDNAQNLPVTANLSEKLSVRLVRAAYEARRERRYAEAAATAEKALALQPDSVAALTVLAASRSALREFVAAAELYRRVLAAEPGNEAAAAGLESAAKRSATDPTVSGTPTSQRAAEIASTSPEAAPEAVRAAAPTGRKGKRAPRRKSPGG